MLLNKQNVIACIKELGSFESGFEKDYEKIIEYACRVVEAEAAPIGESESTQLIFLAAARAYYAICITQETSDDFTSFTAGDVTIAGMASKSARKGNPRFGKAGRRCLFKGRWLCVCGGVAVSVCETVKKGLVKTGKQVYLAEGEWVSAPFYAVVAQKWRSNKSNFEPNQTPVGEVCPDYFTYVGPYDHDICALSDNAVLIYGNDKFIFKKKERVTVGGELCFYWAIARRVYDSEEEL